MAGFGLDSLAAVELWDRTAASVLGSRGAFVGPTLFLFRSPDPRKQHQRGSPRGGQVAGVLPVALLVHEKQ